MIKLVELSGIGEKESSTAEDNKDFAELPSLPVRLIIINVVLIYYK
jgi:hypothetical protein